MDFTVLVVSTAEKGVVRIKGTKHIEIIGNILYFGLRR
jgi:hypothetical protein